MADKKRRLGIRAALVLSLAFFLPLGSGCGAPGDTPAGPRINALYCRMDTGKAPSVFTPVSVTLNKDGTAGLALSPISSYGVPQGPYSIIGDELVIYSAEDGSVVARFEILGSDTLAVVWMQEPLDAAPGDRYRTLKI